MNSSFELLRLTEIDSTNRFLKDYCLENRPENMVFCTAEKQTQGLWAAEQVLGYGAKFSDLVSSLPY